MEFTFTNVLLTIIALAISIIAIKVTFSFDINKYLESRKKDLEGKIQNYCTHVEVVKVGGKTGIQSAFISPSGTLQWYCKKCGLVMDHIDRDQEQERLKYFLENPKEYAKQEKKFEKLLKKRGLL